MYCITTCATWELLKTWPLELDVYMHQQWCWGKALDLALKCDYAAVERFLSTGSVVDTEVAFSGPLLGSSTVKRTDI